MFRDPELLCHLEERVAERDRGRQRPHDRLPSRRRVEKSGVLVKADEGGTGPFDSGTWCGHVGSAASRRCGVDMGELLTVPEVAAVIRQSR